MADPEQQLREHLNRHGQCAASFFYTNGSHVTSPPLHADSPEAFYRSAKEWFVVHYGVSEWNDVDTVLPSF